MHQFLVHLSQHTSEGSAFKYLVATAIKLFN